MDRIELFQPGQKYLVKFYDGCFVRCLYLGLIDTRTGLIWQFKALENVRDIREGQVYHIMYSRHGHPAEKITEESICK